MARSSLSPVTCGGRKGGGPPLLAVIKPRIAMLLVYSTAAGYVAAAAPHVPISRLGLAILASFFGVAGAEAISAYTDLEVDRLMERTRLRPVPSGRLSPSAALAYGFSLSITGHLLALALGIEPFLSMLAGSIIYLAVYSLVLKRRTSMNIVLGSWAGAMPLLVGYTAARGLDLQALYMAGFIVIWTPPHIWSLAIRYLEDYRAAGIPMLPVLIGPRRAARIIAIITAAMIGYSLLGVALNFGLLYLLFTLPANLMLAMACPHLARTGDAKTAFRFFKLSSPYLFLVLTGIMLDRLLHSPFDLKVS
jgi:protoheme IX farnesyltransferase